MYKRLPQWIVFNEQYINIEIAVNALGSVVNMLFIEYTKLLLIEINMYMDYIFVSFFIFLLLFFLILVMTVIMVTVFQKRVIDPVTDIFATRYFSGNLSNSTMQLNHHSTDTSLKQTDRCCRQYSEPSDN